MAVYSCDGIVPVVNPQAYVHPEAVLIGDVIVGPACYIGACAVLRGDFGRIIVASGANIQDTCVVHSFRDKDAVSEEDGHIGHGGVLHGCRIGRNALVGMNSVIMDGAAIGENSIVAAMAFVKAGSQMPANSLVAGIPARVVRSLNENELASKREGTAIYQHLALSGKEKFKPAFPLPEIEPNRQRVKAPLYDPLILMRLKS